MFKLNKFKIIIFILIILEVVAIYTQINFAIKYNDRIIITQFEQKGERQSMGYMLKTNQGKIIMIDGGSRNDTEHVKDIIFQNGGIVDTWFLTHAHDDHFGVLLDILSSSNSDIEIKKIYLSLNSDEWYKENDSERYEEYYIKDLLEVLDNDRIKKKVHVVSNREELKIDNLNFRILKVASPDVTTNAGNNQSVVIKVNNMKKSVLFLGDIGKEVEDEFIKDNMDEIDCDVVQMSHHGQNGVTKKVYELISPEICLWPTPVWLYNNDKGDGYDTAEYKTIETRNWMNELNVQRNYVAKDGDIEIKIY